MIDVRPRETETERTPWGEPIRCRMKRNADGCEVIRIEIPCIALQVGVVYTNVGVGVG